jgi:hypothetical protein
MTRAEVFCMAAARLLLTAAAGLAVGTWWTS